ncbi:Crp/Fnr family transcriptional regulator (plasmid) [Microvirga sp. RSM25]|uniref:Crp/Fnr family transcriptional regulator n=1 Tax=Microvirga sp. RSM25 TaxID=3273802 RepID=UPI00384DA67A
MISGATSSDHRANRFLAALDPDDYATLEAHLESVDLARGTVLYDTGAPLIHTYFPHDSIVSLVTVMADGHSVEMGVFGREALVGIVTAVVTRKALGRYIVLLPGTASRITTARMHEAIATRPALRHTFLCASEALISQTLLTVACNAVHDVEARCCRWLLSTHDRVDRDTLPLTHELLAEMMGVQRSTVSTITRALHRAGLIAQGRGGITVRNRAGLERRACECYGRIRRTFEHLLPRSYPASTRRRT